MPPFELNCMKGPLGNVGLMGVSIGVSLVCQQVELRSAPQAHIVDRNIKFSNSNNSNGKYYFEQML